jgi:hypothetical protein
MGIVFLELRGCWIVLVGGDPLQSFPVCCDRALLHKPQTLIFIQRLEYVVLGYEPKIHHSLCIVTMAVPK